MKKLNAMEMRNVDGGATYTVKCSYCGKKFSATYWGWLWIAKQAAIAAAGSACRKHEINCFYKKYF